MRGVLAILGSMAAIAAVAALVPPAHALAPNAEAGAELAARWCADCHVVAPSGIGTDAAPPFSAIANKRSPDDIRSFLVKPHAQPMRGFALTTREIEDVTAYIETLQQRAEGR